MIQSTSISIFLQKVLEIYKSIYKQGISGVIEVRITFLESIINGSRVEQNNLTDLQIQKLLQYIFEAFVLAHATYSKGKLKIYRTDLLGKMKNLKNLEISQQKDWIFQLLIQSWLHLRGTPPLKDLRADYKHSVCEYRFENSKEEYLIECKKLNKGESNRPDVLIETILGKIDQNQLGKTEISFDIKAQKKMFVDITSYIDTKYKLENKFYNITILGPTRDWLENIESDINNHVEFGNKIDELVICWYEYVLFDNIPRVILHKGEVFGNSHNYSYDGLSLETFPMKGKKSVFSELKYRTSIMGKNYIPGIITTMNMLTDESFSKVGQEEIKNDY